MFSDMEVRNFFLILLLFRFGDCYVFLWLVIQLPAPPVFIITFELNRKDVAVVKRLSKIVVADVIRQVGRDLGLSQLYSSM